MNTCACGNTLVWLSEIEAGECDACSFRRDWDAWNRWQVEFEEREEGEPEEEDGGDAA